MSWNSVHIHASLCSSADWNNCERTEEESSPMTLASNDTWCWMALYSIRMLVKNFPNWLIVGRWHGGRMGASKRESIWNPRSSDKKRRPAEGERFRGTKTQTQPSKINNWAQRQDEKERHAPRNIGRNIKQFSLNANQSISELSFREMLFETRWKGKKMKNWKGGRETEREEESRLRSSAILSIWSTAVERGQDSERRKGNNLERRGTGRRRRRYTAKNR